MDYNKDFYKFYAELLENYQHDLSLMRKREDEDYCKKLIAASNENICQKPVLYKGIVNTLEDEIKKDDNLEPVSFKLAALKSLKVENFTQAMISACKEQDTSCHEHSAESSFNEVNEQAFKMCSLLNEDDARSVKENLNYKIQQQESNHDYDNFYITQLALKSVEQMFLENNQIDCPEQ